MGTRADLYVGRGENAEWLGSVAMDGYPTGLGLDNRRVASSPADVPLLHATTEDEYRRLAAELFARRDDATLPDEGWPWPWGESGGTDYAYAFEDGGVWASYFGRGWFDPRLPEPDHDEWVGPKVPFPNMTDRQNVTFGKRSGLIVLGFREEV